MLLRAFLLVLLGIVSYGADKGRADLGNSDNITTGSLPAGLLTFVISGTCPTGFTEVTALAGRSLYGTLAANGDVGGTGGADSITPAGTNSAPALAMNAYTPQGSNAAPGLTMNSYTPAGTNATSTVTPLGSNATSTVTPLGSVAAPVVSWPAGVPTFTGTPSSAIVNHVHVQSVGTTATGSLVGYTYDASTSTSTAAGYSTANPTGGVASYTPGGTNAWPAGVPTNTAPAFTGSSSTVAAQTFTGSASTVAAQAFTGTSATLTGSVAAPGFTGTQATLTGSVAAPAFTGTQFDNRSAYLKVIFCVKD